MAKVMSKNNNFLEYNLNSVALGHNNPKMMEKIYFGY
jgi:hypothetical protein